MRLYEYESKIKELVEENPENPEIYNLLQRMIHMFLRRKAVGGTERDVEDISYTMAGDMWLRIIDGERFYRYVGYISKIYHDYVRGLYIDKKYSEPYDPSYDMKVIGGESYNRKIVPEVINKVYLEQIENVIDEFFESGCKYRKGSRTWVNLKLSLALSLYHKELVAYHLNKEQSSYLKILLVKFYEEAKI